MILTDTDRARFWSKVDKNGPVHPVLGTRCWLWTGSKGGGSGQQPQIRIGGKAYVATRIAWAIEHGELPAKGVEVCHHCDNPPCVRSAHHFLGSHADNMGDAAGKGRIPAGQKHWTANRPERRTVGEKASHAKLTSAQVLDVRASATPYVLGNAFGLSKGSVYAILKRQTWAHLAETGTVWKVLPRSERRGALHSSKCGTKEQ